MHPGKLEILQEVHQLVREKQDDAMRRRLKFRRPSGEQVIVRDVSTAIARWIDKFKKVGDVTVQYDPGHATLLWAGVRILLQVSSDYPGMPQPTCLAVVSKLNGYR
jgi:hypothetical protein